MRLLAERVEVWRPVSASPQGGGLFRLTGQVPDDETWEFQPGDVVRVMPRRQDGDVRLMAVSSQGAATRRAG